MRRKRKVMKLVDTSCWIEVLRPAGNLAIRQYIYDLMDDDEAAWCDVIRLELWNSLRGQHDAKRLNDLEAHLPSLSITDEILGDSIDLAILARGKGLTVPSLDLIIAACARYHKVEIESRDKHFEQLAALK